MDIKKLILHKIKEKGELTVSEIVKETGFSRVYIHRFFQSLIEASLIMRVGHANRARYVLAGDKYVQKAKETMQTFKRKFQIKGLEEDRVFDLIKKETGILESVSENIVRIVEYAFTEMLNNAIEHSRSKEVVVSINRAHGLIRFDIVDKGIGVFENLVHVRHLSSIDEAIQDLLKGKQTTAPEEHSGEGIFFTRRIADKFIIQSSNKKLFFDNIIDDFTIMTIDPVYGTKITFIISDKSAKELTEVFMQYTNEDFEFGVSEVTVKLYQKGEGHTFISRSQARRILYGLDKFQKIILDFNGIDIVGQGFADEIFRVWKNKYPKIKIEIINANNDVLFMINRV